METCNCSGEEACWYPIVEGLGPFDVHIEKLSEEEKAEIKLLPAPWRKA